MTTVDSNPYTDFAQIKRPGLMILIGGIVTTILALALVMAASYLSDGEFNLMGIYIAYIIPISAIGVGIVAGSGYSFVS